MHEWHITEELLETICLQAEENKMGMVTRIDLSLGESCNITEDSLRFCLQTLSQKTIAKDALVNINSVKGAELVLMSIEGE